jgi:hypothetical protein
MKNEHPILFNSAMVRAILKGHKTQTRRVVKVQPPGDDYVVAQMIESTSRSDRKNEGKLHWVKTNGDCTLVTSDQNNYFTCPYGKVGDYLWVKETWFECVNNNDRIYYTATETPETTINRKYKKYSSLFMRKNDSRITLKITHISIEKLNNISHIDAKREGLTPLTKDGNLIKYGIPDMDGLPGCENFGWDWCKWDASPVNAYKYLWESINGEGSWNKNPYVWVITFEVLKCL